MTTLPTKRALVTGGGGAIGRASSLIFAREGARVAVVDVSLDAAAETARLVNRAGGEAIPLVADVRDDAQAARAVDEAAVRLGGIDVLFNNAGIMSHEDRSVLDGDEELWREIHDVNLFGTMRFSKHAAPHIEAAGGGAIVNMSSFLAVLGCSAPQDAYTASKGAIASLTRSMAVQLGPRQIRVNALAPGPIATAHVEQFFPDPEARSLRLARFPLGRFGRPEDVGELACFVASDAASWLTGQVIVLDGGSSCNYL
ncbi:MAG: short-chain dehydrogenase [Acidimicrobiaceae bacterium]|nr:short-chain dehydrogenase [Acidimicrobiaceae bacterium]